MAAERFTLEGISFPDKEQLICSGNLTIQHINQIHTELEKILVVNKDLNIIIKNIDAIDLTFIQLLLSIKKEFNDKKLKIKIDTILTDEQALLLKHAGFNNL